MPSKQVTDRKKSALAVASAGRTHTGDVSASLRGLLSPYLKKGEDLPDIALLVELTARALDSAEATMSAADEANLRELSDDDAPRRARDEAAAALSDELVALREWLTGLYGPGALKSLGFSSATPEDPVVLERFAGEVISGIQAKPLPKPRYKGVKWDPTETIAKIETLRTDLQSHLADVAREVREAEATLRAKVDAIVAYDERFSGVATFLVGLFRLAGETALAERVRPSSRRPGQTEADASGGEGSDKPKDG